MEGNHLPVCRIINSTAEQRLNIGWTEEFNLRHILLKLREPETRSNKKRIRLKQLPRKVESLNTQPKAQVCTDRNRVESSKR